MSANAKVKTIDFMISIFWFKMYFNGKSKVGFDFGKYKNGELKKSLSEMNVDACEVIVRKMPDIKKAAIYGGSS